MTLSDEEIWDPLRTQFNVSTMKAERYKGNISSCNINFVHSTMPMAPPVLQVQDDIGINEYDKTMAEISTSLVPELMAEYMVSSIQTQNIRKRKCNELERDEYATITDNQHHGVSAELLAWKWGIGLNKAKATLKGTTQKAIQSAVLSLTR